MKFFIEMRRTWSVATTVGHVIADSREEAIKKLELEVWPNEISAEEAEKWPGQAYFGSCIMKIYLVEAKRTHYSLAESYYSPERQINSEVQLGKLFTKISYGKNKMYYIL